MVAWLCVELWIRMRPYQMHMVHVGPKKGTTCMVPCASNGHGCLAKEGTLADLYVR